MTDAAEAGKSPASPRKPSIGGVFRSCLAARHEDLLLKLLAIERDQHRAESALSTDADDWTIARENDEVLNRLQDATQSQIDQIQHALERIQRGRFGICEHCNWPIEVQRLAALPEVTLCACCASIKEDAHAAVH